MKTWFWKRTVCKATLATAVACLALGAVSTAHAAACSNASLKGKYGQTISGQILPGPGRIWPEMVWPYLPFSEAFEHAAACAVDTAPSARQATAVANVALQNVLFQNQVFIFLSPQSLIFWARRPQSSRSRGRLQEPGTIGNGAYLTMR